MLWEAGGGAYDITRSLRSLVMSFRPRPQPPIALVPDIYLLDRPGLIWWSTRGVKFFPVLDLICEYYIHGTLSFKQQSPRTSLSQHCSVEPSIYLLYQMIFPDTEVEIQVSH